MFEVEVREGSYIQMTRMPSGSLRAQKNAEGKDVRYRSYQVRPSFV